MGNLKIKIGYKWFHIEIEWDKETVISQLDEIKVWWLGNLWKQIDMAENSLAYMGNTKILSIWEAQSNEWTKEQSGWQNHSSRIKSPSLLSIFKKSIPYSGAQWVLICSQYCYIDWKDFFTRMDLKEKLSLAKQWEGNLTNDINRNIELLLLDVTAEKEYFLTPKWLESVKNYIESPDNHTKSKITKKEWSWSRLNSPRGSDRYSILDDLNIEPKGETPLSSFLESLWELNKNERITAIVYYLQNTLKIENITIDHIVTAMHTLKEDVPRRLDNSIRGVKKDLNYLKMKWMKEIKLSMPGVNFMNKLT